METIAAIATPPGIGGISVIRISGKEAFAISDRFFYGKKKISESASHTIHYGQIKDGDITIDTVTASVYKNPNSFTGEDIVEFGCHGGVIITDLVLQTIIKYGARHAEPGEFTKRAFLNGKLDLTQVEAVADIIHSTSLVGAKTSARQLIGEFTLRLNQFRQQLIKIASLLELELDFSEEDIEFQNRDEILEKLNSAISFAQTLADSYKASQIARSGFFVGIAGFPNSGKSTLFNSLLGRQRAIVTDIAGTTRDYLEETFFINGIAIKLIDTAGLRETTDTVEIEGIKLVHSVLEQSNLIIVLNDAAENINNSDELYKKLKNQYNESEILLVQNKIDLINITTVENTYILISAKENTGLEKLRNIIELEARNSQERVNDILINQRHYILLGESVNYLQQAKTALINKMENEVVAYEIRESAKSLGKITGETWDEDVLNAIFAGFCIGK